MNSAVLFTWTILVCCLAPSHQGSILDGLRGHLSFSLGGGGHGGHGGHGGGRFVGPKLVLPSFLTGGRGGHGALGLLNRIPGITLKHPGHGHHHAPPPPLIHHHAHQPHPHVAHATHHAPVVVAPHHPVAVHAPVHHHHAIETAPPAAYAITHHIHKPILVAPPIIAPPTIIHAKPVRANLVYVPLAVLNGLAPPGSIFVHHDDHGYGGWSGSGAVAKIPLLGEKRLVIPIKTITGFGGGIGLGHASELVGHAHLDFGGHHDTGHAESEVIDHVAEEDKTDEVSSHHEPVHFEAKFIAHSSAQQTEHEHGHDEY